MPETTYIVRLYTHDGWVEDWEQARREDAEELFETFSSMPEEYEVVELVSYDYATHDSTLIKQS